MNTMDRLSPVEIGERLKIARESARVTQEDAAASVGLGRTTLVAIEKGQRAVRLEELQALANCYGISINALLRTEAVHVDLLPRFRRLGDADRPGIEEAARLLNDLVRAEVELENVLGVSRTRYYPPERPLLPGDVRVQAERDAHELRRWLGIGDGPIPDLLSLLELQLGIRVYVRPLHADVSGLFAYDDAVGACILVNSLHRREHRTQTGGHEMGHFTATRRMAEIYEDGRYENSREERYANAFGRAFLMPAAIVIEKFKEVTAGARRLTRRHVIVLAHFFGVSRQAAVMRLEELELTTKGTWDWFVANGGISDDQVRQVLGDRANENDSDEATRQSSLRLDMLAGEAAVRDLISEEQLAKLLKVSRLQVRALVEDAAASEDQADGLLELH